MGHTSQGSSSSTVWDFENIFDVSLSLSLRHYFMCKKYVILHWNICTLTTFIIISAEKWLYFPSVFNYSALCPGWTTMCPRLVTATVRLDICVSKVVFSIHTTKEVHHQGHMPTKDIRQLKMYADSNQGCTPTKDVHKLRMYASKGCTPAKDVRQQKIMLIKEVH